jgi:GNAT superfamily N-acetyltransferase
LVQYTIRPATLRDAPVVARHRVGMFRDMGQVPTDVLATALLETSTAAIDALLRDGSYVGWFAIDESDRVLAGAGAQLLPQLPRISHDRVGVDNGALLLVLNVYTEPAYRTMGIARALMNTLMDWAKGQGFDRVLLHASDAGRPLYESLGFVPTNHMRWSPSRIG